ncbi:MAG: type II secretion system protein [Planctomycetes bacterium]|nr:type II secretion system protein [Planctomycetota bacterium]
MTVGEMRWREGLGRPNQAKTRSIIAMLCERFFSIVELVAVIPILGILAAFAAPKSFNTSANNNSLKQTLSVVRNAMNRYAAAAVSFPKQ